MTRFLSSLLLSTLLTTAASPPTLATRYLLRLNSRVTKAQGRGLTPWFSTMGLQLRCLY